MSEIKNEFEQITTKSTRSQSLCKDSNLQITKLIC